EVQIAFGRRGFAEVAWLHVRRRDLEALVHAPHTCAEAVQDTVEAADGLVLHAGVHVDEAEAKRNTAKRFDAAHWGANRGVLRAPGRREGGSGPPSRRRAPPA